MTDEVLEVVPEVAAVRQPIIGKMISKQAKSSETVSPVVEASIPTSSDWWLREGVKGEGPRPDYLSEKYKTVEDQAKSYLELEKKLGMAVKVPDEYDFGAHKDKFDTDNPVIKDYLEYAKQNKVSQDVFSKTIGTIVNYLDVPEPNIDEICAQLGEDGRTVLDTVTQWASNTFSQESLDVISDIARNADVIRLLDEMRQLQYHNTTIIPVGSETSAEFTPLTKKDVEQEMATNYARYKEDPGYRDYIQRKFKQVLGNK